MLPIGIEIGSNSIKAVELVKTGNKYFLSSYAIAPATAKGIATDSNVDFEVIAEIVKKVVLELKTRNRMAAIAIDQSLVFTRVLEMPQMTDVELASAINWEAEEYIPLPISQVRLEWQIMRKNVNQEGEKRMDVLLVASPRNLIDKYHHLAEAAGLELKFLEPESIAILRALSLFNLDKGNTIVVNFGNSKTDILISSNGSVSFVRSVATGSKSLTRAIAKSLNISEEQAENYKLAYGFDASKLNGSLVTIMQPIFDVLIEEIKRAIVFQQNKDPQNLVKTLALCGAGSSMPNINVLLSNVLNLEVVTADPFVQIAPKDASVKIASQANQKFLVAVGLAMNEI